MSSGAAILVTAAGVLLILGALRDVFDTLFHPGGKATASRAVMRAVWFAYHRLAPRWPRSFALAGPTALLLIISGWAAALILGWALIFWPHMTDGAFAFQPGVESGSFIDSVYISVATLATVGYGDVTPHADWLRVVTPLEALLGFGLLTASISWLATIYPVLLRRRSLAYEIYLLRESQRESDVDVGELEPSLAAPVYAELTGRLVAVERDLVAFPIAYYFAEPDDRFALPVAMPYLFDLACAGAQPSVDPQARLRAVMLRDAIRDFAATAAKRFHGYGGESTRDSLAAYARDHLRGTPLTADGRSLSPSRRS
jgi:hypothetical protein